MFVSQDFIPAGELRVIDRNDGGFAQNYPDSPVRFRHGLCGHPLMDLNALAHAAGLMRAEHVECRRAKNRNGEPFEFADPADSDAAQTIRSIARHDRWVMLRFAEQRPEYAALMHSVIDELSPVIRSKTGEPEDLRTFIFVSSPGTLTPFHFDPEYNVLFQIAGRKRFAVCPPKAPFLTGERLEACFGEGDNMLPWREDFRDEAHIVDLGPGEALFVPYGSPHWVEVEDEASISLSLTWKSRASFEYADAWNWNAWLRRRGLDPKAPHAPPARNRARALACRAARRIGLM